MKNRYWVFAFDQFYPCGGLSDVIGKFDNIEDAEKCYRENQGYDAVYIYDMLEDKYAGEDED